LQSLPSISPNCRTLTSLPRSLLPRLGELASSESLALFLRFRSLAPSRSWRPALSFPCLALLLVAPSPPVALFLGVVPGDWSHQFYVHFLCLLSRFPTYYQRTLYIKEKKTPLVEINYICLLLSSLCLLGFAPSPLPFRSAW